MIHGDITDALKYGPFDLLYISNATQHSPRSNVCPVPNGSYVSGNNPEFLKKVAGLIKPLEKAIEKIPAPVAAAMLAGVLLRKIAKQLGT